MGCFIGCFGGSKDAKRRNHRRKRSDCSSKEQLSVSSAQDDSKTLLSSTSSQIKVKPEEQLNLNLNASNRKKVTFDTNVRTYEPVLVDEVEDLQPEKSVTGGEEEQALVKSSQLKSSSKDSSVTSTGSHSSNHRYQNCRDSDDEYDEMDYCDSDLTEDDDGDEEYDEFGDEFEDGLVCSSATIDVNEVFVEEVLENDQILTSDRDVRSTGLNPNARDRSVYVHPVLNPVENLTQWKAAKAKRTPSLRSQKENCISSQEFRVAFSAEPSFKETAVNASLSNWLVSSEITPVKKASSVALYAVVNPESSQGSNSTISHEDRPILGALTVEELKQFSMSGSAEDSGSATSFKGITERASTRRVQVK